MVNVIAKWQLIFCCCLIFLYVSIQALPEQYDEEWPLLGTSNSDSKFELSDSDNKRPDSSIFDFFPGQPRSQQQQEVLRNSPIIEYVGECRFPQDKSPFNPLVPGAMIRSRYRTVEILTCGAYGAVIKAIDVQGLATFPLGHQDFVPGQLVAVKIIFPAKSENDDNSEDGNSADIVIEKPNGKLWRPIATIEDIQNESEIIEKIRNNGGCEHCIPILNQFQMFGVQYIVMPIMETSLHDYIYLDTNTYEPDELKLTWFNLKSIARQLFQALKCLHSLSIVHNDVKPDNIMMNYDRYRNNFHVNLIDFGLSAVDDDGYPWRRVTPFYEAPEISLRYRGSSKSDIWSLGLVLAEIVYRRPIFPMTEKDLKFRMYAISYFWNGHQFDGNPRMVNDMITKGADIFHEHALKSKAKGYSLLKAERFLTNSPSPDNDNDVYLEQFRDLVLQCLQVEPEMRISAEDALLHPFLSADD